MATKTQLELFTKLTSNDKAIRLSSAAQLIDSLSNEEELKYSLNRLTKGLSSGRESARIGFAVALTELLTRTKDIRATHVLDLLVKHNTASGNLKGQDERDFYFGLLFGLQSIVYSGILTHKESTIEDFQRVVDLLLQLSGKKNWLQDVCFYVIYKLVEQIPEISFSSDAFLAVNKLLQTPAVSKSTEGVGLFLCLTRVPDNVKSEEVAMANWEPAHPLHKSNLVTLSKIMRQADASETGGQNSAWKQKIPMVWKYIFEEYQRKTYSGLAPFHDFWAVVVDEGIFSSTSSLERKFWGFQIMELALDYVSSDNIGDIFSKNFLHCLINHLSDEDRYLYRAAKRVTSKLEKVSKQNPTLVYPIAIHLLGERGSLNFDRVTNTKLVEHILPLADEQGILQLFQLLLSYVKRCPEDIASDTKAVEWRRQWATDTMLSILRSNRSIKQEPWVRELLEIFIAYGYFEVPESEEVIPKFSEGTQNMFRLRLMSALSYLSSSAFQQSQTDHQLGDKNWPYVALNYLLELEKSPKNNLLISMDESVIEIVQKSLSVLHKVTKKIDKKAQHLQQLNAFQLLYSLVLLQVYAGDTDSIDVLEDIDNCYSKVFNKKSKRESTSNEPTAMEILTEVMLSLLSRPSLLLRKLVDMLFTSFSEDMNRESIHLICDVLKAKESVKDSEGMFAGEEVEEDAFGETEMDEDDFEEIDTDEIEEQSDWEMISNQDASDNEELERKLDKVLEDADAKVKDEESSEEELMNDEQMLALDEKLAEVFRERKKASNKEKKKNAQETKQQIVQFKVKVIDLIDNYYKTQPNNGLGFEFLIPLLEMILKTKHKVLEEKGQAVFRNRLSKLKWTEEKPSSKNVLEALKKVHVLCGKKASLGSTGSSISQLLLKLLADTPYLKEGVEVYLKSFLLWIQEPSKSHYNANIFHDFINWGAQQRLKHQQTSTAASSPQKTGHHENEKTNH